MDKTEENPFDKILQLTRSSFSEKLQALKSIFKRENKAPNLKTNKIAQSLNTKFGICDVCFGVRDYIRNNPALLADNLRTNKTKDGPNMPILVHKQRARKI